VRVREALWAHTQQTRAALRANRVRARIGCVSPSGVMAMRMCACAELLCVRRAGKALRWWTGAHTYVCGRARAHTAHAPRPGSIKAPTCASFSLRYGTARVPAAGSRRVETMSETQSLLPYYTYAEFADSEYHTHPCWGSMNMPFHFSLLTCSVYNDKNGFPQIFDFLSTAYTYAPAGYVHIQKALQYSYTTVPAILAG
jgi:hypothetical protein